MGRLTVFVVVMAQMLVSDCDVGLGYMSWKGMDSELDCGVCGTGWSDWDVHGGDLVESDDERCLVNDWLL